MLSRTVRLTAATLASLSLLTACGSSGESTGATTSPAPATTSSIPADLRVPAPLPTADLLNNPCNILTAAEAAQIGLAYPGEKVTEVVTGCRWTSSGSSQNFVHVTALPQNTGGISDIYDQKSKEAYFEPTSIDGYPALYADTQDGRPSGTCTLWVGVTDHLAASVIPQIGTGRNRANPCGVAKSVATAVVQHLKAES
jgi:hypothetical protein